jgi:hypothetical protein
MDSASTPPDCLPSAVAAKHLQQNNHSEAHKTRSWQLPHQYVTADIVRRAATSDGYGARLPLPDASEPNAEYLQLRLLLTWKEKPHIMPIMT